MVNTAIGYVRVSRQEQVASGLSMESQEGAIREYCRFKKLDLHSVVIDPGVSGGKPLEKRNGGKLLFADHTKFGCVIVVARLDRLFRSVSDASTTIERFALRGSTVVSLAEGFDMGTPFGRAMLHMLATFAELERAIIGERTRAAIAVKRSRGERISRDAPFGFSFVSGDRKNSLGETILKLAPCPRERTIIAKMKAWRRAGMSLREIAVALDIDGVVPRRGGKWAATSVEKILAYDLRRHGPGIVARENGLIIDPTQPKE